MDSLEARSAAPGDSPARHHVVIVGAGFGGLEAAKRLDSGAVRVTLIDRSNHHLFQPLLYQVATAGLSAPAIAAPIRHILRRQRNLTVLLHEVVGIDHETKRVLVRDAEPIAWDSLIVASGATHSYFGNDGWARVAPGLKTLADAMTIRSKVLLAYEHAERDPAGADPWLRFVVIGGGPTGVEMAGTLAEIARHTLRDEFRRIAPKAAEIVLVEASSRILSMYPKALSDSALEQCRTLGVDVRLDRKVVAIDEDGVTLEGGARLASRTVIWAAGVQASPLGRALDVPLDRAGRVPVNADLGVPGRPGVYVIGDLAAATSNGNPVPGVSPAAKQMGRQAARNLLRAIRGEPGEAFVYRDYGSMATIGRSRAIAKIGAIELRGYLAWLAWLFVHLFFLIGFRNRLMVMTDWAWAYWTFNRGARVVWDGPDEPGTRRPRSPAGPPGP
ncbi:MAG: NAD(P)/FAD-dependent oxidoreductase [Lautropia sp.]